MRRLAVHRLEKELEQTEIYKYFFFRNLWTEIEGRLVDIMARVSAISPQQMGFYYQTPLEK